MYKAISTVYVQAMPGAATFLGEALSLAVASFQATDKNGQCFLNAHQNIADEWVIHRHWLATPRPQDESDALHATLMELLASGRVRNMRFDTFSCDAVDGTPSATEFSDG